MPIDLNQFSQLLRYIAESLDISESHYKQAEERYQSIGRWLERDESTVASYNPEIYPQGSFLLGTVTKPISNAEEYDMDMVNELSLQKNEVSQKQLKNLVGYEIKAYARANNMKSPVEEGRRCWTLNYADGAQFHMDILPAIPDAESFRWLLKSRGYTSIWSDLAIAITDNTLPNYDYLDNDWPRSNPRGYAAWFRERMKTEYDIRKKRIAESINARVEDVPEYRVRTPLQRAVQILKRHRDIMFADEQDDKPVSIIITTLAAHAYNNEADLLQTMLNIVEGMPNYIQVVNGVSWVPNPVNPLENFADKWQEHPKREENFKLWLNQVRSDLSKALKMSDIRSIGKSLEPCLGKQVVNKALQKFPQASSSPVVGLVHGSPRLPNRFNVPHRQAPKWPIAQKDWVKINGSASRKGFRPWQIKSDARSLPKNCSLQFEAQTNVPHPYKVYWQVVNTGNEARSVNQLRGGFYDGIIVKGCRVRQESTLYHGMHWIECFIVKNGVCWARSGEFVVNIE